MHSLSTIATFLVALSVSAQNINGSWHGELNIGFSKIPLALNLPSSGNPTLDSPMQGAKGLLVDVTYLSSDSLSCLFPTIRASYSARLHDGELKGIFEQNGFQYALNMKPGMTILSRPQTPQPPFPYKTKEVTFTNPKADISLSGTLTLPEGAKCVLLMVTGSGNQNRDEELLGHKPFAVIADRLARVGIATLRYDDRAVGKSIGGNKFPNLTTQDNCDDALSGIEWLRNYGKFKKVGVLGHSEGGTIAFMLGAMQKVDFIVSLAASVVRGDSVLLEQNKFMGLQDLTIEQLRQMPTLKQGLWFQYFLDYDPRPDIRKVSCPVFALNGSNDVQVFASQHLPALRRSLANNKHHLIKQYEGLNHLFQHCQLCLPTEYGQIEETISEAVLAYIISWVQQVCQ